MKLLPALFLVAAFAFTTVVNGAPSTFNPIVDAMSNSKDFWLNIKCIYDVLDKAIDGSDVDDLWHDVKIQIKAIANVEWKNCLDITDGVEQEKCKITVISHGITVVTRFLNQLVEDHKMDIEWQKIRREISTKCFRDDAFYKYLGPLN